MFVIVQAMAYQKKVLSTRWQLIHPRHEMLTEIQNIDEMPTHRKGGFSSRNININKRYSPSFAITAKMPTGPSPLRGTAEKKIRNEKNGAASTLKSSKHYVQRFANLACSVDFNSKIEISTGRAPKYMFSEILSMMEE